MSGEAFDTTLLELKPNHCCYGIMLVRGGWTLVKENRRMEVCQIGNEHLLGNDLVEGFSKEQKKNYQSQSTRQLSYSAENN